MKTKRQFTIREMLLLVMFISVWLSVTLYLSSFSVLFWGFVLIMAAVLRPPHQRRPTPDTISDVMSVAVSWAVFCGIAGLALDMQLGSSRSNGLFSWSLFGQLTGFYLGLLWVIVVHLVRHVERVTGGVNRPRPSF